MASEALREKVRLHKAGSSPATLRALRMASGLSQRDIATEVGVTPAAVSHWERGARRPRPELLARYVALIHELKESA